MGGWLHHDLYPDTDRTTRSGTRFIKRGGLRAQAAETLRWRHHGSQLKESRIITIEHKQSGVHARCLREVNYCRGGLVAAHVCEARGGR